MSTPVCSQTELARAERKASPLVWPIKESEEFVSADKQIFSKLATDEDPVDLTPVASMDLVVMAVAVSQNS